MNSSIFPRLVSGTLVLGLSLLLADACGGSGQTGLSGSGGGAGRDASSAGTNGTGATGGTGGSGNSTTGGGGGTQAGGATSGGSGGSGGTAGSGNTSAAGGLATGGSNTGGSSTTGGSAGASAGGTSGTAGTGGATGGTGGATTGGTGGAATGGTGGATTGGTGGAATGGTGGASTGGSAGSGTGGAGGSGTGCRTDSDCADAIYCNGVEKCVAGTCVAGTPIQCRDDGHSCTKEFCDETTKSCKTFYQDSDCQDGKFCNGIEHCNPVAAGADPVTGCAPGTPVVCSDGISCTQDSCDEATQACKFTPNDAACNDFQVCTVGEKCDPTNSKDATGCVPGTPRDCDDQVPCTIDSCSEVAGGCVHVPDDSQCDDGLYCDGAEFCDVTLGCQTGTKIDCPDLDGIACTKEFCDEQTQTCQVLLDNSICPSGQVCKSTGCAAAPCTNDSQCDDGLYCNGKETCSNGKCVAGPKPQCADTFACTTDVCDETSKSCQHLPVNQVCDDGDVCNGTETCSTSLGCVSGTPLSCPEDNFSCTKISCDPILGCVTQYQNQLCSDGKVCNGTEICDPTNAPAGSTTGCVAGTPLKCADDGVACTTDTCSEAAGGCVHTPDNTKCTGCGYMCDAKLGCVGPSVWCTQRTCQGNVFACGDCIDNDGDCKIDSQDEHCLGPCSDNEAGFRGDIPGQNQNACEQDCYFDKDSGNNDGCTWDHRCDTLEKAPGYDPEGKTCTYDPSGAHIQNGWTCSQAYAQQSAQCLSYCGPLTPNGCDCFGCCLVPGAPTAVWLGSGPRTGGNGQGTCNINTLNDPTKCRPCTQVPGCLNTCQHCEICVGKPTLPPDCTVQQCPTGSDPCGLPGQAQCPLGFFCSTGCCHPEPQ